MKKNLALVVTLMVVVLVIFLTPNPKNEALPVLLLPYGDSAPKNFADVTLSFTEGGGVPYWVISGWEEAIKDPSVGGQNSEVFVPRGSTTQTRIEAWLTFQFPPPDWKWEKKEHVRRPRASWEYFVTRQ